MSEKDGVMPQACRDIRDVLSRHLDGECRPEEAARVRAHVARCAGCRAELDRLGRVDRLVRTAVAGHPFGPALAARVCARVAAARAGGEGRTAAPASGPVRPGTAGASPNVIRLPALRRLIPYAAAAAVLVAGLLALRQLDRVGGQGPSIGVARLGAVVAPSGAAVRVRRAGVLTSVVPGQAVELRAGDEVVVAPGAPGAEVRLDDGSHVTLDGGTVVALAGATAGRISVGLDEGRLVARVAPRSAGRAFAVRTADASVEVVGTVFGVHTVPGEGTRVAVLDGRVLCARGAESIVLSAGEAATVRPASALAARAADARAELAWALGGRKPAPVPAAGVPPPAPRPSPAAGPRPQPPAGSGGGDLPIGAPGDDR